MMATRSSEPGMPSITLILALVSALICLTAAPLLPSMFSTCPVSYSYPGQRVCMEQEFEQACRTFRDGMSRRMTLSLL